MLRDITIAVNIITAFAFNKLRLNKCLAGVYASNKASIKVLENKYIKEGHLSQLILNKSMKMSTYFLAIKEF